MTDRAETPEEERGPRGGPATNIRARRSLFGVYSWAREENAATDEALAHLRALRSELEVDLLGRPGPPPLPFFIGDWEYRDGSEAGTWWVDRRPRGAAGDWHRIHETMPSRGEPFLAIGVFEPSDDGRRIAVSVDRVGDERFLLEVRDVERDRTTARIENAVDVAWASDGEHLFATIRSVSPYRAFRLVVVEATSGRITSLWEESDRLCRLALRRSDSGSFVFLDRLRNHSSKMPAAAETLFFRGDRPSGPAETVLPETEGVSYQSEQIGDDFYLRIDDAGPCFRVVRMPVGGPRGRLEEVVPHRPGVPIAQLRTLSDRLLLLTRASGLGSVDVHDLAGELLFSIAPEEIAYKLVIGRERVGGPPVLDHRGGIVPVSFSSFVTPRTIDEHDASTGESLCRSRHEVEGHEPNAYRVERLHAPGRDGIPIPVSLLRSAHQGVPGPVLLKGYGAYGFSQDAEFDPALLRLVDRGVMFALAHVRGGGELGAPWHDAARRRSKHVSVEDFVSVAEHLVVSGVAMPDRLVIVGRSAGGTLVAAALNARPDLFAGVVAMVPLADLMDCQSDESMPFSINERQEWGDPVADELDRERLSALCPTTNATDSPSPPVLATAAIHDGQVRYWQPATWVEALREARGGGGDPVLLHVSTEGGHHGPSRREAAVELVALEHAFTLDRLGLTSGS